MTPTRNPIWWLQYEKVDNRRWAPNFAPIGRLTGFKLTDIFRITAEFRRVAQILDSGEDLAPDQAIALQAKAMVLNDEAVDTLSDVEKGFLQGSAAALAVLELRDSSVLKKLPLISRALLESENQRDILESVVKSVSNIGPSTDIILKPVKFFVLERGEQGAIQLWKEEKRSKESWTQSVCRMVPE